MVGSPRWFSPEEMWSWFGTQALPRESEARSDDIFVWDASESLQAWTLAHWNRRVRPVSVDANQFDVEGSLRARHNRPRARDGCRRDHTPEVPPGQRAHARQYLPLEQIPPGGGLGREGLYADLRLLGG